MHHVPVEGSQRQKGRKGNLLSDIDMLVVMWGVYKGTKTNSIQIENTIIASLSAIIEATCTYMFSGHR
eukprot:scaffold41704_cov62-Attheya_sp.AAC.1